VNVRPLPIGLISLDFEDLDTLYGSAAERGLGWVEVYLDVSASEQDTARLLREQEEHGIRVASISSMAKLAEANEEQVAAETRLIERSIGVAAAAGAQFATFMYGNAGGSEGRRARERFLARVAPLLELAEDAGVTLLLENVFSRGAGGDLDSVDAILELFAQLDTDRIGLNFDPANLAVAGEEAGAAAFRSVRHLIRSVHLKDVRPLGAADRPLGARRVLEDHARGRFIAVPLGQGILPVEELLTVIATERPEVVVALEPTARRSECAAWLDASLAFLEGIGVAPTGAGRATAQTGSPG
jgi:sugar phosphate isomerase/epimerase